MDESFSSDLIHGLSFSSLLDSRIYREEAGRKIQANALFPPDKQLFSSNCSSAHQMYFQVYVPSNIHVQLVKMLDYD